MELDKLLLEYLNTNYFLKNNLLNDKNYDTTVLPHDVEKVLMKIFSTNKDITHITLFMWLSSEGMTDIAENWFKCKMINVGEIPDDMIDSFRLAYQNSTEDLNYNYQLIDG